MHSWCQPGTADDGLDGVGGRGGDIGTVERLGPGGRRLDGDLECGGQFVGQRCRLRPVAAGHPDLPDRAHPAHRLGMRPGLCTGAQNGQHRGVLTSQQARRERRTGGGPGGGDRRTVQQRRGLSGVRIEGDDQCLVGRHGGPAVLREDGDQLAHEHVGRRDMAGHGRQEAVPFRYRHGDAVRGGSTARTEIRHRRRQRVDQCIHLEQRLDLRTPQYQHPAPPPDQSCPTDCAGPRN